MDITHHSYKLPYFLSKDKKNLQFYFIYASFYSMKKQKFLLPVLLMLMGGLGALGFAPLFWWPLTGVSIILLTHFINQVEKKKSAFALGFFFGCGWGAVSMNWLTSAFLVEGAGVANYRFIVWLAFGLYFGLFWGATTFFTFFFPQGWRRCVAFAGLTIFSEYARSQLFSGFPWNPIGNILNPILPIMQTTALIGIYGLSGLTVLFFSLLSLGYRKKTFIVALILAGLVLTGGYLRLNFQGDQGIVWGTRLRIVQPNIPQTLKWNPQKEQEHLTKIMDLSRQNAKGITHILWPETAVSFLLNYHHDQRLELMRALNQGSVLITGAMRAVNPADKSLANSIFILDDLTDIQGFYDKSHLVPFGEYMPLKGIIPLDKFVPINSDITTGTGPQTTQIYKTLPASLLVCYEVIFSGEVVDKIHRPAWIFNATNDGWYGLSAGPHQHFAMAQTRAIEEGLPLVRSANTGISAIINPYGQVLQKLNLGSEGVIDTALPQALSPTLFARFGQKIPLTLGLLLLIFAFKKKNPLDK